MKVTNIAAGLGFFALALVSVHAHAATLCVLQGGQYGCHTHISDAVASAAPGDTILVGPGTYAESVVITKPLSLSGYGATVDATGLAQGFFVNGIEAPGLASVHITGFTVENAQLEGILVANASGVTIASNTVRNNNKALVGGSCSALPAYEPGEAQDCGEGLHLLGADHTIVTNNIVQHNAGGILISDDTGITHDNLISYNTVSDNPYACGITMASHVPAALTGSTTPLGVFHNTVYKNQSMRNGLSNGGGAGVGIFASIPGAMSYGNVVVENLLTANGHPGIAMHAHAPHQLLSDNMIVGNIISGNGADTADAATPGPTGINVYSLTPAMGNILSGNVIESESYDVVAHDPALVQVEFNSLLGAAVGVKNLGTAPVDAADNWWGCATGPLLPSGCSSVSGLGLSYEPWVLQAPPR